jgi:Protein of unknown function (DUF1553)/Protein of unknown function (DUF1549)
MTRSLRAPLAAIALLVSGLGCGGCGAPAPAPVAPPPPTAAPVVSAAPVAPPLMAPAEIDRRLRTEWARLGLTPAPAVDDARFLRRAYLDLTGRIPPVEDLSAYLADKSPDKRQKAVDALLASPRWVDHWTNYWDRVLLGKMVRANLVDRDAFRAWLHGELAKNVGWNKLATDLITASGDSREDATGAVNWFVKFRDTPADLAGTTSKIFLGVQIQCAQCHDHKTEAWKMDDFRRFAACFAKTQSQPAGEGDMAKQKRYDVHDSDKIALPRRKEPEMAAIADAPPAAIDGTDLSKADNRRQALAAWMTAPNNPWFAKAAVNRIWAHFLGRGFVDPVADFRPSNPPAMPELLDALASDFIASGYDMKHLMRVICESEAYQLASSGGAAKEGDKVWSRFRVEPLGPDELVDSVLVATKIDAVAELRKQSLEELRARFDRQFTFLFDVDEESDDPDYDGSIPQALFFLNGAPVNNSARVAPGSALAEVLAMEGGDDAKIRSLYLRTLSREPDAGEVAAAQEVLATPAVDPPEDPAADAKPKGKGKGKGKGKRGGGGKGGEDQAKKRAYEDLLWALINSSEFALNH